MRKIKRIIESCDHKPYLTRWTLIRLGEWFAIFVHKFHQSDEDRFLHDHPWPFLTVILTNGYWEWTEIRNQAIKTWYPRFKILFRRAEWRHRIEIVKAPTWTLVIRFKRWREWGFWPEEGFVHWTKWWSANCE